MKQVGHAFFASAGSGWPPVVTTIPENLRMNTLTARPPGGSTPVGNAVPVAPEADPESLEERKFRFEMEMRRQEAAGKKRESRHSVVSQILLVAVTGLLTFVSSRLLSDRAGEREMTHQVLKEFRENTVALTKRTDEAVLKVFAAVAERTENQKWLIDKALLEPELPAKDIGEFRSTQRKAKRDQMQAALALTVISGGASSELAPLFGLIDATDEQLNKALIRLRKDRHTTASLAGFRAALERYRAMENWERDALANASLNPVARVPPPPTPAVVPLKLQQK